MSRITVTLPLNEKSVSSLHAGDRVSLSGVIFTARDAAHARLCALLNEGKALPVNLAGGALYYTGPSPANPGSVIGSAGPTTSSRMDEFTPGIIEITGLRAMIGKGNRGRAVVEAMRSFGCVYFAAIGGAGALIARTITACEVVAYEDLGPEAIHRLTVRDLPLITAIDVRGNNLYESGPASFRRTTG